MYSAASLSSRLYEINSFLVGIFIPYLLVLLIIDTEPKHIFCSKISYFNNMSPVLPLTIESSLLIHCDF